MSKIYFGKKNSQFEAFKITTLVFVVLSGNHEHTFFIIEKILTRVALIKQDFQIFLKGFRVYISNISNI